MTVELDPRDATVLLVDDHPENLRTLTLVLEPIGCRLLTAQSGEEALKRLLTDHVSVILLDVRMPGMNGYETAAAIKQRERTRDIPIIFMTAMDAETADVVEAFSTGALDFVTKPFDANLLRAKVHVFIELAQKTELLRRHSEALAHRLDERYAAEAAHLRKLTEAAIVINSTLTLDEMLRVINESAREVIGAHEAETIITVRSDLGAPERTRSFSPKYAAWADRTGRTALSPLHAYVVERGEVLRMTQKEIEASFAARGLEGVASGHPLLEGWLAVPLVSRGRTLGLMQVADKVAGDFTADDEVVLVQLAQLAAVAIDNADRFEQEHVIAQTLQTAMLPQRLPDVRGMRCAVRYAAGGAGTQVGGDWYDVIPLGHEQVLLAVGDVVGRGPQAAAVMGQLRTAMRAYALQQLPLSILMRSLDRLLQDVSDAAFATAAAVLLDVSTGRMECVSAGHPPPLVVDPTGAARYLAVDPHVPLGVDPSPVYAPNVDALLPGSTVLLFTDGLVESPDRPVHAGLERARQIVESAPVDCSVDDLCDRLLRDMLAGERRDDVALLAVRLE